MPVPARFATHIMNYQHAFHAGNFADVHKHVVLTRILEHLRAKPAAFRVIDSHAGAGRYDLLGPEATRSGEWRDGIERVLQGVAELSGDGAAAALLRLTSTSSRRLIPAASCGVYPGSPLIAKALLRPQDRLIACELEPRAAASLKIALRGDPRAKVLTIDGWMAVNANVPPKERRGLVLIDPPYEDAGDFMRLSDALGDAHRKWPTGIYMLWYPIKERDAPDALARRLRQLGVAKILRCEITRGRRARMRGWSAPVSSWSIRLTRWSGTCAFLARAGRMFSPTGGRRLDWLAGEQASSAR